MAALLKAQLTRRYHGDRHLKTCPVGQWIGRWGTAAAGVGAPCGGQCAMIHAVLAEYHRQPGLWSESACETAARRLAQEVLPLEVG